MATNQVFLDTDQVVRSQCATPRNAPANGTICLSTVDESGAGACFEKDIPRLYSYSCPMGDRANSNDDKTGSYCPSKKPPGADRCCTFKNGSACARGNCVTEGHICCGKSAYCDASKDEECNATGKQGEGVCCGKDLVCGEGCLTDSSYTCCGDIHYSSSSGGTCVSGIYVMTTSSSSTNTPTLSSTQPASSSSATSSDFSAILATAIPESARTVPNYACFLSAQYTSQYPTPDWYRALPTNVQSAYASISHNTTSDLCTAPQPVSKGMSAGATAGIGIGAALGVILLAILALWRFRPGIWRKLFGRKEEAEKEHAVLDMENARLPTMLGGGVLTKSVAEKGGNVTSRQSGVEGGALFTASDMPEKRHEMGT